MEPRIYQLKNRIKYVENLRSGSFEQIHENWLGNNRSCGGCAIGIAILTMEIPVTRYNFISLDPFGSILHDLDCKRFMEYGGLKERQLISEFFGFNYLDIREISIKYEGNYNEENRLTHSQIANYIEEKHITPYIYMIGGKHLEKYRNKVKEELVAV